MRQRGDSDIRVEHLLELERHLVGDPCAQALHAVDLELEEALNIVSGDRGVLFAEPSVNLFDDEVLQEEAFEVHVEGQRAGAEIAFLPGREGRLAVLDEGAPEQDRVVELETDIFKACSSYEAAEDGSSGEE